MAGHKALEFAVKTVQTGVILLLAVYIYVDFVIASYSLWVYSI